MKQRAATTALVAAPQFAPKSLGAIVFDVDLASGDLVRVSGLDTLLGFESHEVESSRAWLRSRVHPDDIEGFVSQIDGAIAAESEYRVEVRLRRKDGAYIWVLCSAVILRNEDGVAQRLVGSMKDINASKLYNEELRHSEERYRRLAEATSSFVWRTDAAGQGIDHVQKWTDLTGQPSEPTRKFAWIDMIHPDDQVRTIESWTRSLETGELYDIEYRIRMKEGVYRWAHVRGVPMLNPDGAIREWLGVCTDIDDRKRAEEEVLERERLFKQLADSMPQIVWTARPDGQLDYYNERWYQFTGVEKGLTGDEGWVPILHPDDVQYCKDVWYYAVKKGEPYCIEYRFLDKKTGDYRWHLGRALPVKDEKGAVQKWYGTCTDIHELKQTQEALALSKVRESERNQLLLLLNDELEQKAETSASGLSAANEELTRFKTDMSRVVSELLRATAQVLKEAQANGPLSTALQGLEETADEAREMFGSNYESAEAA